MTPPPRVAVADDLAVLDLDPGPQVVGEAEPVRRPQVVERRIVGTDVVGRREVVVGDAHLRAELGHARQRVGGIHEMEVMVRSNLMT